MYGIKEYDITLAWIDLSGSLKKKVLLYLLIKRNENSLGLNCKQFSVWKFRINKQ